MRVIIVAIIQSYNIFSFIFNCCSGDCIQNGYSLGNSNWGENDVVSIDLDMDNRILRFYVNKILQKVSYSNIPQTVKIFVCYFLIIKPIFSLNHKVMMSLSSLLCVVL
jgi:hypothetical protein